LFVPIPQAAPLLLRRRLCGIAALFQRAPRTAASQISLAIRGLRLLLPSGRVEIPIPLAEYARSPRASERRRGIKLRGDSAAR